ncbi:MAG TPA: TonB-dependent receptor, partial [Acidobacteriaceae bacterium]|nr:TonB-dependent receptor [Acidobacteriaceae bacterium]
MRRSSNLGRACLLSTAMLLAIGGAGAQSMTQGGISGTVFDPTDAAVPNARIVIHNDGSGADLTVTSGANGEFRAPLLQPGTYTVTISAPGFSTSRQINITVAVNQVTELNPHLPPGETTTSIEVTGEQPVIQFDSPAFGGQLSNREIENIPINNRRWSSLALTTPGVTNDASGFGLLSFRSIPAVLNNVQIDGVDDNQAFFGEERGRTRAGYSTSQVAVREFQVNTGVYSAELGRAVGGVVNSITKTGTNALHGEVYFYHRGDEFSSINPKVTIPVQSSTGAFVNQPFRPKDKRNQYGFGVGGPLIKDRLFWFYAFDAFRRNFPGVAVSGNPGVFNAATVCTSALLTATGRTNADCTAAFNDLNGDLGLVPRFGNQLINTPKLTWQINNKHTLNVYYHRLRWDSPGGVQSQAALSYARDSFGTDFVKLDYGVAKLDSVFGSNLTNELRYQYARELNDEGQQPYTSYSLAHLLSATGNVTYASITTSAGGFNLGSPYYSYRVAYPDERKWQIGDTAAYLLGRHTIRFGADIVHNYDLQNNLFQSNGSYSYASPTLFLADILKPGGACMARTGAGTPSLGTATAPGTASCYSSLNQGFGGTIFDLATLDTAYFVQDDWKVTPRLTVNLGVRYDYEALPAPYARAVAANAPQEANHPSDKNNFAPRIGFAWDPFGLGKTVVRGGFGMYYGRMPNGVLLNTYVNTGTANGQASFLFYNGTPVNGSAIKFPNIPT